MIMFECKKCGFEEEVPDFISLPIIFMFFFFSEQIVSGIANRGVKK
ncbi:hypothetical protein KTC97_17255 [Clostridium estertheticum]|nr:hypothetical protein [Clostridium estertheticum]WLC83783.1 hypothetical protein KTC97_17255 [Clostridium estertheticum]